MLFAELGSVKAHCVHSEEVPELEIVAAAGDFCRHSLMLSLSPHILRYVESAFLCFAVTFDPFGQCLDTFNPDFSCQRVGVFLLVIRIWTLRHWPPSTPSKTTKHSAL
jgi:hypothetical protein